MDNQTPWWGEVKLDKAHCLQLGIAPLYVAIEYSDYE